MFRMLYNPPFVVSLRSISGYDLYSSFAKLQLSRKTWLASMYCASKRLLIYSDFSFELLPAANKLNIAKHPLHSNFV